MVKAASPCIIFAVCGTIIGCANPEDREYLLAHGFRQFPEDRSSYKLEHVRLGDVSRDLGFPLWRSGRRGKTQQTGTNGMFR